MTMREDNERREYYRIDDTMALEFSRLSGAQALATEALHDSSPLFNLLSELHVTDFESQHLLRHISERDRTLANYLKVMNKRIDLLGQALAQTLMRDISAPRKVSLSEGGVSFVNPTPVENGSHLALKMMLMPQALGLLLRARVVHCTALEDGQYDIGTEFEALTDAQRQLLARHILQRQALERRLSRETPASS
ncbi:PilZ domain-containing protein [Pseudomonas mangrovi]|uniref:Pilus assembly protein PilZ n=1 Tax=Pseudomonas mangrovi TaxID=2161748 RepID=A0A2T5P649_9PSED|nr:PilZ domain-containing protein [Pseudomonas mangrovi]PTU73219.1 pilus assembly protein PilZ [Pseudomonas mangrovi]